MPKAVIVIVDGVSQGAKLANAFKLHAIDCVHVQTVTNAHDYYLNTICAQDYLDTFHYRDDFFALIEFLKTYEVEAAIAGFDTGVELADQINAHYKRPGNSVDLSAARRDKFLQQKILQNKKINSRSFRQIENIEELRSIQYYPVVLKPLQSASADQVYLCDNQKECRQAFTRIMHSNNDLGEKNHKVLVEDFLQGRELKINTVSFEGQHYIAEAWDMSKKISANGFLYQHAYLVGSDVVDKLKEFVYQTLDNFEIEFAAATIDIMLTDQGAQLIELGARLMGAVAENEFVKQCLPVTQLDALILAYADSKKFFELLRANYQLNKYLHIHYVHNQRAGVVTQLRFLDEIKALSTVEAIECHIKLGDEICVTHDYSSIPIKITLLAGDEAQFQADLQKIKHLSLFFSK